MSNQRRLSGIVASSGKGEGKAVIIAGGNIQQPLRIEKPYVLVADLTTPDLIPFVVEAEAIITDIGGLSSHAANIARELGIPCIVATKYASEYIKWGDFVKVDADNNVLTWNSCHSDVE